MEDRTKRTGLDAFLRILEHWGLQEGEGARLLGLDQIPEVSEVTVDQLERISHTLAIYGSSLFHVGNPASLDEVLKPSLPAMR